ncbi:unnamed protein product, partial [Staurois parvus]
MYTNRYWYAALMGTDRWHQGPDEWTECTTDCSTTW